VPKTAIGEFSEDAGLPGDVVIDYKRRNELREHLGYPPADLPDDRDAADDVYVVQTHDTLLNTSDGSTVNITQAAHEMPRFYTELEFDPAFIPEGAPIPGYGGFFINGLLQEDEASENRRAAATRMNELSNSLVPSASAAPSAQKRRHNKTIREQIGLCALQLRGFPTLLVE
jgi:hypothetical protein